MTSDQTKVLNFLRKATEPIVAVQLAGRAGICYGLGHEAKRRHVRQVVHDLRKLGHKIVSSTIGGYWLTEDDALWSEYLDKRMIDAKRLIGDAKRKQRQLDANKGQGMLFVVTPSTAIRH
jgi:hypothetical protein